MSTELKKVNESYLKVIKLVEDKINVHQPSSVATSEYVPYGLHESMSNVSHLPAVNQRIKG